MMTKCQKRASIQGLWLLSMVLLASSSLVCASMAVDARVTRLTILLGQTKEDINATSVTSMNMTRSSSASYNMTGGGGELNRGQTKDDINTGSTMITTMRATSNIIGNDGASSNRLSSDHDWVIGWYYCKRTNTYYRRLAECLVRCLRPCTKVERTA
ncbi:uncharacterized protein [Zea mays]|uniref:uncharacterized protein isoform X1 n=1 Tax=Zea mays TaxID=4577 RepID=UPI0004DEB550|nr:uncharacterized protein LOC100279139 isoform X1 [Zea mays]|eukprot:XP_008661793.1 uncharacterized protein LOC100279139 isoform X1 [Zea mays]